MHTGHSCTAECLCADPGKAAEKKRRRSAIRATPTRHCSGTGAPGLAQGNRCLIHLHGAALCKRLGHSGHHITAPAWRVDAFPVSPSPPIRAGRLAVHESRSHHLSPSRAAFAPACDLVHLAPGTAPRHASRGRSLRPAGAATGQPCLGTRRPRTAQPANRSGAARDIAKPKSKPKTNKLQDMRAKGTNSLNSLSHISY